MPDGDNLVLQAAAIPLLEGRICLVTSSSGKRWVIPKGIIDPGRTAPQTALLEAWEEAGLEGVLQPQPVGAYRYEKWGSTCAMTVFLMTVTKVHEDWPEHAVRERVWLKPERALTRIRDEGLRELMRKAIASGNGREKG